MLYVIGETLGLCIWLPVAALLEASGPLGALLAEIRKPIRNSAKAIITRDGKLLAIELRDAEEH